jgi:hypothetical protein
MKLDDAEFLDALSALVAAHLEHKRASQAFLAEPPAGDTDDKLAQALDDAHLGMVREGTNIAILAMQRGITPPKAP